MLSLSAMESISSIAAECDSSNGVTSDKFRLFRGLGNLLRACFRSRVHFKSENYTTRFTESLSEYCFCLLPLLGVVYYVLWLSAFLRYKLRD
jgi:hypothetical protein